MPETEHKSPVTPPLEAAESLPKDIRTKPFAAALDALRAISARTADVHLKPSDVELPQLMELPQVFQIRDLDVDERHVSDLLKLLSIHKTLDPITVWPCGDAIIVIDGHHRLEAYRRWNRKAPLPVTFFEGTVEEAIQFAESANGKVKLQLGYREKANYAWKLVVYADELGKLSKAQLIQRTHISKGTIDTMRKVARELGVKARTFPVWDEAHAEWKRLNSGEEREVDHAWLEAEAMKLVDRLGKSCGKTLTARPEITAKAFSHILGRKAPDIALMMLEEYGLRVTLHDGDGNVVDDLDGFEPPEEELVDVPF
ncbi:ParB/RepB/Spo0J family partition protein [Rhizobium mulingense]|uniref:ParB/RepB/Spo0J family partition protein n=1 Tax=Rhizobium mulingense TaxID=3031128 RepID=UPI002B45E79E|nr:ParB/RepB/Spo0J family partition protein [Rhizobium sp. MJ21]MEB3043108.1 ParB/RepB/Spo0J family partition protein [Rhizobium sp. MJ21]